MGHYRCVNCGREYEAKRRKANGLCNICGFNKLQDEINQLQQRTGVHYDKWKAGMRRWNRDRKANSRAIRPPG